MKEINTFLGWFFGTSKWRKQMEAQMAEIERQRKRVKPAYDLHRYVLRKYGFEGLNHLTDPDKIIEDTKPITLFNYFEFKK